MSIARYEPVEAPREWIALLGPAVELAKAVGQTEFVPVGLRNNVPAITAAILYGDEVGLKPMRALAEISVIEGRPTLSAEALRSLALEAGHELWIVEATNSRVTVAGRRRDSDQVSTVTWTMDDARRAKIAGKMNWTKYPRQMLIARATADLCRAIFADAIGGFRATEELEDSGELDGSPEAAQASGRGRRRRATLSPVAAPQEPALSPADRERLERLALGDEPEPEATGTPSEPREPLAQSAAEPGPTQQSAGSGLSEQEPEPSAADGLTQTPAFKKMQVMFREAGIEEREARLVFARFAAGRKVASSKDLTAEEIGKVIDALEIHRSMPSD